MTKAELVEEVARVAELNKRDAEVIVETVFDSIISALHKGEKVELRGFGSFRTRERGPRRGRNPKTGEAVDVPAKRVPYFKPGKGLKEYFTDGPEGGDGESETSDQPDAEGRRPAATSGVASETASGGGAREADAGGTAAEPATTEAAPETTTLASEPSGSENPGSGSNRF